MNGGQQRVMYFTDSLLFGGTEQMLLTLMQGLDRSRWKPLLAHYPSRQLEPLLARAQSTGIETIAVPPLRGREGLRHLPDFVRLLRSKAPAVFHAHLTMPLACKFGLFGAALARVSAVIATEHLFVNIPYRHSRWVERLVAPGVHRYIAVSYQIANELRRALPFMSPKLRVVHNGIPIEQFAAARGETRQSRVVLTVARLTQQKGIQYLLRAAAQIPDADFWIAGDGPDCESLQADAAELGVANRVKFLGYSQDVTPLLRRAELFVLPSLFEGLPVSVLEAMAAGVPVIATDVGGTREEIQSGQTGILVPPADPDALAAAISGLLRDPDLALRMAAQAQIRVRQEFSVETMVARTTEIYDTVLARRGRQ